MSLSLTLGGGLLIFASVLSDAFFERPRRSHLINDSFDKISSAPNLLFDYKYGWSFFAAGAAFFMSELAAVLSISAYIRRFPTVEEMVRVTVPGAERRLKERNGLAGEYLVEHQNKYQRHEPDTSGSLTSGLSSKCYSKTEILTSKSQHDNDIEGIENSILFTKPAPDICASNSGMTEDVITFTNPPLVSSSIISAQEGTYCLRSSEPPYILNESKTMTTTTTTVDGNTMINVKKNSSLAGQTVPIVLMNNNNNNNSNSNNHNNQRFLSSPSFVYAPVNKKEKLNYKTSISEESASCCLGKPELRQHAVNTLPSRRFHRYHCNKQQTETCHNIDRELLTGNQFIDIVEDRRMLPTRRFDCGLTTTTTTTTTHMSPELDSSSNVACTYFETFHSDKSFIPPGGILRTPLDMPGTSSTTSSSSGGTSSGMTVTTGSSLSNSSRTTNFQTSSSSSLSSEKKKKKAVTIGNVFSTLDTFETNRSENLDLFDSGSAV